MHHVWLESITEGREALVYPPVAIAITATRHIDYVELDARLQGIDLLAQCKVGRKRVLFACKHMYFVAGCQPMTQRLGIDLRPRVVAHRVAVDDLKNFHRLTPLVDRAAD